MQATGLQYKVLKKTWSLQQYEVFVFWFWDAESSFPVKIKMVSSEV